MLAFLLRRFLGALLSIFLAALLVFSALLLVPGDPAQVILGINASPQSLATLRDQLGLNEPPVTRFFGWFTGILRGDFGESLNYRQSVASLLIARLKVSIPLALGAILLAIVIALPLGITAAVRRGTGLDLFISVVSQLGAAIPSFWLGLMFILLFSVELGWLPSGGYVPPERNLLGTLRSLTLPIIALGLGQAAVLTRMTRSAMLETLSLDYIRTAKAKGLPTRRVLSKHALRNALVTLITVIGLSLSQLLVGAIVIEQVFSLPGLGQLVLTAISTRDFPLLQGEILLYASAIVFLSFLVDVSYGLLDPRIRYS